MNAGKESPYIAQYQMHIILVRVLVDWSWIIVFAKFFKTSHRSPSSYRLGILSWNEIYLYWEAHAHPDP